MTMHAGKTRTRPQGRVFVICHGCQAGYTLVELIMVIMLMGILATNVMPRFFEASRFEAMGYADAILGTVRYARKIALATRCDTRVEVTPISYALYQRENDCTSGALTRPVARPGSEDWSGSAPSGVSVGTLDIYFDAQGRPHDSSSGTLITASQTLSVGTRSITLEPATGYVHSG